ncbi:aspartic peptidase domain-containing protein [Cadophora sp. MPI-SDFR-AT-0126]|nr:aspartic peptidase domain-containing protein [Leotiomycetes sp. MPI-SDFR-AT-0126]
MSLQSSVWLLTCSFIYLVGLVSAAKVVSYPVSRALSRNEPPLPRGISGRSNFQEILSNNKSRGAYYASVEVGTPAQKLSLMLSTGSSDIWVIASTAAACKNEDCLTPFNPNISQTISTVAAGGFNITYVDGYFARGDYIKDLFAVGDNGEARVVLQMGLASNITDTVSTIEGIMGIGYSGQVATSQLYPNFMDQMVSNGLTNTRLYSLWLNSIDSHTGSILFGGIDTEKYYGTLYSMPIHKDRKGNYTAFTVGLTSLSITPEDGTSIPITKPSFSTPIVLESSTTIIYLPSDVVRTIYNMFDVTFRNSTAFVDCKYSNSSYMTFAFESGSVVNVAYSELINKIYVPSPEPTNLPFSDVCVMGILEGDGPGTYYLGDFFLRSAYVVFDLTNNRIGIAQSNQNSQTSNIVEVPSGAASIPQSTGLPLPSKTPGSIPSEPPDRPPSTPSESAAGDSSSDNKAIAIGVGVAVPVFVLLAAACGFCLWCRRRRHSRSQPSQPPPAPLPVSELADPSNKHNQMTYSYYGGDGLSPMSNASELHSASNVPNSPGNARDSFTPTVPNASELPVYRDDRLDRPMSPNLNDYHEDRRPVSNLTAVPDFNAPVR